MIILAPREVIDFENSVNSGGIPYVLLPEKQQKSSTKFMYLKYFRRAQLWVYPNFIVFLDLITIQTPKHIKQSP